MKREFQDLIRMLLVGLALLASVEPMLCPLLGALHLDHDHAQDDGLESHEHCHGDHPAGGERSERDHDHDHDDGCEHCHEHQSKLAVRIRTGQQELAAQPALPIASPPPALSPTLETIARSVRDLGPRGRPDGLPPLPLLI